MKPKDRPTFKPSLKVKTWNPEIESVFFQKRQEERILKFDEKGKKLTIGIDTPPRKAFQAEKIIIGLFRYFLELDLMRGENL